MTIDLDTASRLATAHDAGYLTACAAEALVSAEALEASAANADPDQAPAFRREANGERNRAETLTAAAARAAWRLAPPDAPIAPVGHFPHGWKVIARKPYNPACPGDAFLSVILCQRTGTAEFVTWVANYQTGGCAHGNYANEAKARADFASRGFPRDGFDFNR